MSENRVFIEEWFPTQILFSDMPHLLPIAQKLFDETDLEKYPSKEDPSYFTTYFYTEDFDNKPYAVPNIPELNDFIQHILQACAAFAQVQGVDIENNNLTMNSLWLNKMYKGGEHPIHSHPYAHYSGTYYLNNYEGTSKIKFYSPVTHFSKFVKPPMIKNLNFENKGHQAFQDFASYEPIPGRVLIWNSWLDHQVVRHNSEHPRMSISFNISVG